jgi:hypothetical protein
MSMLQRLVGSQNLCIPIWLADGSSTTGAGKTGLTGSSSGLIIAVRADGAATPTVYSAASANIDTIATIGTYAAPTTGHCRFGQVDATNEPGSYELQFSNTVFASGTWLKITVQAPGSSVPVQQFMIDLQAQSDVRSFGGVAGTFSGGLPSVDVDSINQSTGAVDRLSAELLARAIGTVTNTGITPTTTVFECSTITDTDSNPVYQYAGVVFTSGANIRRRAIVLSDQPGTAGRRFTISGVPTAPANGDTLVIL